MPVEIARIRNFANDKNNTVPITASYMDSELDQLLAAINQAVTIRATAPSSPINGQLWLDTTAKWLKQYRNNEFVIMAPCHVGTAAPTTAQEGDLWYKTSDDLLYTYNGSAWTAVFSVASLGGTPAPVLSTSAAAGNATTFLRTNDQLAVFDATVPSTQAFSDAAATGSAAFAARRDHKHAMPAQGEWVFVETITLSGSSAATSTFAGTAKKIMLVFNSVATTGGGGVDIVLQVNALTSGYKTTTINAATLATHARTDYFIISAGAITVEGFVLLNLSGEGGIDAMGDLSPFTNAKLWRGSLGTVATVATVQSRDGVNPNGTLSGTVDVYSSLSIH